MIITSETPVAMLTVGQLRSFLEKKDDKPIKLQQPKKYVYGLAGIRELFKVSHVTAQRYKDGILKDAVSQNGRKIIVDVDKAMELFKSSKRAEQ